ncbi:MAG: DNA-binding response regulator [Bacteroidetes bacterium HGW-Bacteroidetes-11]|nr:MAG: DNA-binding response regulator [Bacteroidetes bacterium HGW-Bacteroidetes-11]
MIMTKKPIKVLIVDDHQLMIEGLKSLLEDEADIDFVAGANSMAETLSFLKNNSIDVILMDINMPEGSGIEATMKIKELYPTVKVIALTMHDDISIITRMVKAGASGYILKRSNMNEVIEALRIVHNNGKYLSINTQQIIMDNLGSTDEPHNPKEESKPTLSAREIEVLNLVAKENSNELIAEKLFISERTVEAHRRNIFIKTKTKSIVGLIKYAISKGLIESDGENK